jgi:hypothetical protein
MEKHHFSWENPLSMAIFNSYVTNYQRVNDDLSQEAMVPWGYKLRDIVVGKIWIFFGTYKDRRFL